VTFSPPESAVHEVTAFQIQKNDDTAEDVCKIGDLSCPVM